MPIQFSLLKKTGTMLAHRARQFTGVPFFLYFLDFLYRYFFGLDSGGTIPLFR